MVFVRCITAAGWSDSPACVEPLNALYFVHNSAAFVRFHRQEQPGNRIGIGRRNAGEQLTKYAASVIRFPGWAGEMTARHLSIFVKELRIRSF